jgi:hypothetical protein
MDTGFASLLRAEWTKFVTVRGWVAGVAAAGLMVVLFAALGGASANPRAVPSPVPLGPGGEPVTDSFYFVHRPLAAHGSITVAVTGLRDMIAAGPGVLAPGTVPWAKAGLIVTASARPGSAYAAMMVTSGHGVRMQDDYTRDTAGLRGAAGAASPRWLRLTRSGDTVTGYDSADGTRWTEVGTARLAGLPATVQGGLFVACPPAVRGEGTNTAVATAVFGAPRLAGSWPGGGWRGSQMGAGSASFAGYPQAVSGGSTEAGGRVTVTGAGDIAPAVREDLPRGGVPTELLAGTFAALIAVIAVGTMFITAEYRHRLILLTLAASPRRGRVLAAKAVVLGGATFAAGLAGAVAAVPLGERLARARGMYFFPVPWPVVLRAELGTAAMLAAAAVLALAVGALVRRSAPAVTVIVVAIVVPYLLVSTPFLPVATVDWLTRITPAAAFSAQQTLTPYPQVASVYTPVNGYYPLAPWAGLAVLGGYAVIALVLAAAALRRRDA